MRQEKEIDGWGGRTNIERKRGLGKKKEEGGTQV